MKLNEPVAELHPAMPVLRRASGGVVSIGARALDVLLPPQCLACRRIVERPGLLCAECFAEAHAIAPPFCRSCGVPLPGAGGISGIAELDLACGRCLAEPPLFARARAVFVYDTVARELVSDLKYRDRLEGRASFGAWLARVGGEFVAKADLIVPVPLHYLRLVRRRYNQAAILAGALARASGRRLGVDVLRRTRSTPSQTGLNAEARARNVRGAFAVRAKWASSAKGAQIVLVDDVLTTGATANACTRALLKAGASEVSVLTLARVREPM